MFQKNVLVICKPAEEKRSESNMDFEVYARVVNVEDAFVYLDRYLKMGAIHMDSQGKPAKILIADAEKYYQPMNDEEKQRFAKTLLGLEQRDGQVHFSANNAFEGWEKIIPVMKETMDVLEKVSLSSHEFNNQFDDLDR